MLYSGPWWMDDGWFLHTDAYTQSTDSDMNLIQKYLKHKPRNNVLRYLACLHPKLTTYLQCRKRSGQGHLDFLYDFTSLERYIWRFGFVCGERRPLRPIFFSKKLHCSIYLIFSPKWPKLQIIIHTIYCCQFLSYVYVFKAWKNRRIWSTLLSSLWIPKGCIHPRDRDKQSKAPVSC